MSKIKGVQSGAHSATNANPNSGVPTPNSFTLLQIDGDSEYVCIQVVGATFSALTVQGTVDGSNWVTIGGTAIVPIATGTGAANIPANSPGIYRVNTIGLTQVRVTSLAAITSQPTVSITSS